MSLAPLASVLRSSPIPWVIAGGFFVGAALSAATRRTRNRPNPERAAARKGVLVCLSLSAAVLLGLAAVFVPGPARILDPVYAWTAGVTAAAAFVALRFRRAAGIPVLVLLAGAVLLLALFLRSLQAFTGETEIATVRVLSLEQAGMKLQVAPRGAPPVLLTMKGTAFAPLVHVVIFDDLLVFLGARTWYRFEGLKSYDRDARELADYRFPRPQGISEKLWDLFQTYDRRIPGVKTAQSEIILKEAREFSTYGVMVQNDGGVEVVKQSG